MPVLIVRLCEDVLRPVSGGDRRRATWHLLDWIGCALAGSVSEAGRVLLETAQGGSSATAFAWGGLGNVLEMDDVDKRAILHPGPTILPAVLALSDDVKPPTERLLDAVVRGYQATIRLGRAVGTGHYRHWHNTGTCGPIGAAVACGTLLNLDDERMAHAMALAVSQAAGFWQTRHEPESFGKQLHTAHAARAGLDAARLAAHGFRGPLSILEGPQGFFAATCPGADPETVMQDYGADWLIHQVSFKPWPACRHAHAAIDAALLARDDFRADDITKIEVATYSDAITFCDRPEPQSVIDAKFSLQHAVAVTLLRGGPSLQDFEPEAIGDPLIAALRARVEVGAGEPFASVYPAHYGASVTLHWDGASKEFSVPDALGDPENPVSLDTLKVKADMLMGVGGMPDTDGSLLIEKVLSLADGGETDGMLSMLKAHLR